MRGVYAVILSPTRELAVQIEKVFKALSSKIGDVSCCCIIGGMSKSTVLSSPLRNVFFVLLFIPLTDEMLQAAALAKNPDIIVATPGRLLHHLQNASVVNLKSVKYLVSFFLCVFVYVLVLFHFDFKQQNATEIR